MCYLIQSSYFKLFFQSAAFRCGRKKNCFLNLESTLEPVLFFTIFIFFFRADLILGNNEVRLNPNNLEKLDSILVKKIRQPGW